MKTSELTGAALDWAVAKCEGKNLSWFMATYGKPIMTAYGVAGYCASTNWSIGGPIIEREKIGFKYTGTAMEFVAWLNGELSTKHDCYGPTPLIAAMRCYVASRLGDEVDIPEELV